MLFMLYIKLYTTLYILWTVKMAKHHYLIELLPTIFWLFGPDPDRRKVGPRPMIYLAYLSNIMEIILL